MIKAGPRWLWKRDKRKGRWRNREGNTKKARERREREGLFCVARRRKAEKQQQQAYASFSVPSLNPAPSTCLSFVVSSLFCIFSSRPSRLRHSSQDSQHGFITIQTTSIRHICGPHCRHIGNSVMCTGCHWPQNHSQRWTSHCCHPQGMWCSRI